MNNTIVFVINSLKIGGAAKMIQFVANKVTTQFDRVVMLSLYDSESYGQLDNSIKRINLGINPKRWWPIRTIGLIWKLRMQFKQIKPGYICSFVSDVALFSRVSSLGLKVVVMSAERGDPAIYKFILKKMYSWAYKHSDYCFFQLPQARDYFSKCVVDKSFIIPNPYVPEEGIMPYFGTRNKTIVSAGRFTWQKGYEILIPAYAIVKQSYPDYKLILFGEGPMLKDYKCLISQLGIEDSVLFPGYVKSVPKAVREEGIFVLSSRFEGIPNSLIEAMSVGIPTVSTDCTPGGADFLTRHGKRGLLVPVDDIEGIASSIIKLIEDTDLRKKLELAGPEVLKELDENKIARAWNEAFAKIKKNK